jgi:hypothetical protein
VRTVSALGKAIKRRGRFEAPVPFGTLIEGVRFAVDSPLEEDGFELVVPAFRETFLLHRFRAANWSGASPGFDDR